MLRCLESPHGKVRFEAARQWLVSRERSRPLLVVAHSLDAARGLMRAATLDAKATFGWGLESLTSVAARLSALPLAERELSVATPLALEAVCMRVVSELRSASLLGRFTDVGDRPGLPRALLRTFSDLSLADIDPARLASECPELAVAFERYIETLSLLKLADRAAILRQAISVVRTTDASNKHHLVCLFDVAPHTRLENELVSALALAADEALMTRATGEQAAALGGAFDASEAPPINSALRRLQAQLFSAGELEGTEDETVSILSAPGESRECVELARRILQEAERGTAFDSMAILLRSPFHYRNHLIEALRRATIPVYFTRGTTRPDPGGRAFLVLLRCAAENFSAVRFAEYVSLGVAPMLKPGDASPPSNDRRFSVVDETVAALIVPPEAADRDDSGLEGPITIDDSQLPRRWETLLVDAAVVGGADRWRRRLAGLEEEFLQKAKGTDVAGQEHRNLAAIRSLSSFALPLIEHLEQLPSSATWGEWLRLLRDLAELAIARPEAVFGVIGELEIVRDAGPVTLTEVSAVFEDRLGDLQVSPLGTPSGKVFVASVDEARGHVFSTVFVPGLAEKLFPQRVAEDPLLSDDLRERIGDGLETQAGRVHRERQALRIAVGCASERLILSYPRFENDKARPRVPSFYALEAIRAAEGTLPGFAALSRRADTESRTRMGWPAPDQPDDAIDAAEYDLSTLRLFLTGRKAQVDGAARYLITENRTLARALQARARRWRGEWRNVDGFVDPTPDARVVLDSRYRALRSSGFSVTALERFASCPYRFFLATVIGLRARGTIRQVEELDAATRGLLFHDIVYRSATELRQRNLLSSEAGVEAAMEVVDSVIKEVTETLREKLAPAIDRVWHDAVEDVRLDVHYWLRELRSSEWQPVEFELPFGPVRHGTKANRGEEPVVLDSGLALRGQIDAVEQYHGVLRATDYKTGEARTPEGSIIAGGTQLQPALYALVVEKLFPQSRVAGGNAYYCTARGEFQRRNVDLDDATRQAATEVHSVIARAFTDAFFPAAPVDEDVCKVCDFRAACGPHERERVGRKEPSRLGDLISLRRAK